MNPTALEYLLFLAPLPIVAGVVSYFALRPRKATLAPAVSTTPVGRVLAERVADKLQEGLEVCFHHRDYCGMGLRAGQGWFVYGQVRDSELLSPSEYASERSVWKERRPDERLEFLDRESFVEWLSMQTDASLRGDGNQRLTISRFEAALTFCETHPSQQWPNYAG
jgi:hypothetical protein